MSIYMVVVDGEIIKTNLSLNEAKQLAKATFKAVEKNFYCDIEYAIGGNIMRKNIHIRGFVDEEAFVVEIIDEFFVL